MTLNINVLLEDFFLFIFLVCSAISLSLKQWFYYEGQIERAALAKSLNQRWTGCCVKAGLVSWLTAWGTRASTEAALGSVSGRSVPSHSYPFQSGPSLCICFFRTAERNYFWHHLSFFFSPSWLGEIIQHVKNYLRKYRKSERVGSHMPCFHSKAE